MTQHFSIGFPEIPEPVADVWLVIAEFLRKERCLPNYFEISQIAGHREEEQSEIYLKLTVDEVTDLIAKRRLRGFRVTSGQSRKNLDLFLDNGDFVGTESRLGCYVDREAKAPHNWTDLINALATMVPTIGAWQWHKIYQCWQGADRTDTGYERRWGAVPPGFRTWHEPGLAPLDPGRWMIDISLNPGRARELAFRVYFYATAEMWLGPHFWKYAKCTKEEVLAADFFIEKRDTPHFLYLKCWPEPFTRPDGEQGRMQQRLWKLFFHEDCEWPPGSGTISDEPLYGPPELMPRAKNRV